MKRRSSSVLLLSAVIVAFACTACSDNAGKNSPWDGGSPDATITDAAPQPDGTAPTPLGEPITTVKVRNEGTSLSEGYVTFGQPFAEGQVPSGSFLAARVTGESDLLPTQVDWKVSHGDGSLRHSVITIALPPLDAGQDVSLEILRVDAPTEGDTMALDDVLSAPTEARIVVEMDGVEWSASVADALQQPVEVTWLEGPLVGEWIGSVPLRNEQGESHPHLTARFGVRAYRGLGLVRVETVLENDWSYVPAPQNWTYSVQVTTCGRTTLQVQDLVHRRQARWRHLAWCNDQPDLDVILDPAYLTASKAVPNYDVTLQPSEDVLANYDQQWHDASGLMDVGLTEPYMPMTGGRRDIGPMPAWNIVSMLSPDSRARTAAMGTADRAGAWPIHYRDSNSGLPISLDDYPYMTILGNPGDAWNPDLDRDENFPECGGDCDPGDLHPDSAHQPALSYYPYLVTGDYYHLEELQFWANWNILQANPAYREHEQGLVKWEQVRGQAWSLRTLAEAAFITPDSHPLKRYFVEKVENNLRWYNEHLTNNPDANKLHFNERTPCPYSDGRGIAPWQDDFFTWAVGRTWELGFENALPLLQWKAGFQVLLMTSPDYCWIFGSIYSLNVRDDRDSPFYTTMAKVYEENVDPDVRSLECGGAEMAAALDLEPGEMVGYSHSPEGYPSNLQIALAVAADSGLSGASDAWEQFDSRSVKPDRQRLADNPCFAILPRP